MKQYIRGALVSILLGLLHFDYTVSAQLTDCVWAAREGGATADYAMDTSIGPDGIFVCGMSWLSEWSWDGWLAKYDLAGKRLWRVTYRELKSDQAKRVSALPDGGCIVSGIVVFGSMDIWLERRDRNGNRLWRQLFGTADSEDAAFAQAARDDRFIFAGTGFLQCWSIDGYPIWGAYYPGVEFFGAAIDRDGGVWAVGKKGTVVGLTAAGSPLWEQTLADEWGEIWWRDVACLADGSLLLSGLAPNETGTSCALVYRYQMTAGLMWQRKWRADSSAAANRGRVCGDRLVIIGAQQGARLYSYLQVLTLDGELERHSIYSAEGDCYPFGGDARDGIVAMAGFYDGEFWLDGRRLAPIGGRDAFLGTWLLPVKE